MTHPRIEPSPRPTSSRRTLFGLIAVVLCLPGCGPTATRPDAAADVDAADQDKPKIALVMKSLANEFFSTMAEGARQHHAANADAYDLVVEGIKDERDITRQVALVGEMVAGGADAIVIAPADSQALIPALRRAIKQGVVVINIDNRLDAEMLKREGLQIPFVGPDNRAGAKQVAEHLATQLTAGDEVIVLEGLQTSENGQARKAGFEEAMQAAGMKIVDSQSAQWEMSKANQLAAAMLSEHPGVKAVLAANDNMALGAAAAVKSLGKTGQVLVVGFDNIDAVGEAIADGRILATADQHGDQLAVYGIEAARKRLADPAAKIDDVQTPIDLIKR